MNQLAGQVRCILRRLVGEGASEIAEAALVMPLAFMILLGIYWFGRAFNTYSTMNDAAREGARVALGQTCATCATPNGAPPLSAISSAVTQVMNASSVDPNAISAYTPAGIAFCPGATQAANCSVDGKNITLCTQVQLTPPSSSQQVCGVSVSFQYPYQFWLPFTSLNMQRITLSTNVQMTGEY
ncbi:MAG TPA: TadE/TadG family type IV pilus assembly protein [Terriglobales bacterium]|nr:TadE/TadG family type IV pilus assembly protein [Terriglobales bacterium]